MSSSFQFKLEKIADNFAAVAQSLDKLHKTGALVGVPEDNTGRTDEGPINNATLAYIHENGSDRAKIPARPFLHPGVEKAKREIAQHLSGAAKAASNGDESGMSRGFNKAGQVAVNSARGVFVQNGWQPVKPATQKRKGGKKTRPLIDTGQLRKSITYVVETDE